MSKSVDFREDVRADKPMRVNRDQGFIEDVKLLGLKSDNGRVYSEAGIEAAIPKYERRKAYANHNRDGTPHPVEDTLGWFEGVHKVPGQGLRAHKFHYLKSHPLADMITEAAERNHELFGFSHHAHGEEKRGADGSSIIESIEEVYSVDLVSDPATTSGLKESKMSTKKITVKAWKEKQAQNSTLRKLATLWEEEGLADMPMVEPEPMPAGSSDDQIWEAFKSAIMAAVDDEGLDIKATLKRIGEILKSYEKLTASTNGEAGADAPATDTAATESKKAVEQVKALREEIAIRDLIESNQLRFAKPEARAAFVKALVPLSAAERTALVEERKTNAPAPGGGGFGPRSGDGGGVVNGQQQTQTVQVLEDTEEARKKRVARFRGY